jgi:hypothetical protein
MDLFENRAAAVDGATECPRCGQRTAAEVVRVCSACRTGDRQPQGETVRLFEPAPNVMPGQLSM